jgi:hypothetical protein
MAFTSAFARSINFLELRTPPVTHHPTMFIS